MLQRYKKQRAGQNGFVPPSIYQPLIFTFHLSIFTLQSYSGLEDGYFLVAFLFVVHEFAACYFDNILDEAFAGFLHRFVLDDNSGVEVYPARFVLCQSGVGGNLHGRHIGSEGDFSEEEVKKAIEQGFVPISLGKSRLRTETAALVACHTLNLQNQ